MLRQERHGSLRVSVSAHAGAPAPGVEEVWEAFHGELLGFIQRRVRSRETSEDILQEVMLRIHRNAAEIERTDALGGWVYAITRNAIVDHFRRASVRREVAAAGDLDPEDLGPEDLDGPDLRGELSACVKPLLKNLPDKYQEALAVTELDGLTQVEAAERLGLSVSGMKSRVQRARTQLKDVLTDCCEIELHRRRGISGYQPRRDPCDCAE